MIITKEYLTLLMEDIVLLNKQGKTTCVLNISELYAIIKAAETTVDNASEKKEYCGAV